MRTKPNSCLEIQSKLPTKKLYKMKRNGVETYYGENIN